VLRLVLRSMSFGLDNTSASFIKLKVRASLLNHLDHEIYTTGTSFCKTRYDAVTVQCQSPNADECY